MVESVSEERFVFEAEWFDQQADLIRKYLLTFYPKDCTIEMVSERDWSDWMVSCVSMT